MEHRYLGNSGLKISPIIYGNWLTHGDQVEEKAADKCVRTALDNGITTFDTADVYANTKAEKILGRALKDQRRESLVLMTKVYWPTGPMGPNDCGLSRKHIFESVHGSLKRLKTDYIDVYQAHRYDTETPLEETMVAFADLVRQGKVHYIGVSEWTAEQIRAGAELARQLRIPFISNQAQYNLLWRPIEAEIVPACEENGMSHVVFSPLAQGVLTGKYRPGEKAPSGSRATTKNGERMIRRWMEKDLLSAVQGLRRVAEEAGCKMNHLALAWLLARRNVSGVIIGASKASQIEDNLGALKVELEPGIFQAIDQVLGEHIRFDPALTAANAPQTRPNPVA